MNELSDELRQDFRDKEYAHAYAEEFLNAYIATQIKVIRQQQNLSQEELALLAGMKQERISVLEDVNYSSWSVKTLKRLARAFDLTLKVSFETFSARIEDISNFSRISLERQSREQDLLPAELYENEAPQAVIAMGEWASQRNNSVNQSPFAGNAKTHQQTPTPIPANDTEGATKMAAGGDL